MSTPPLGAAEVRVTPVPVDRTVANIQGFLAERSTHLGEPLQPEDVTVIIGPPDAETGLIMFHARYGGGQRETSLAGVLIDDGPPELRPGVAIGLVFDRWLAAGPRAANPARLAGAVEFLLDPAERYQVILTTDDIANVDPSEWRALVRCPVAAEGGVEHGIVLWRVGSSGPAELRITRDVDGRIRVG